MATSDSTLGPGFRFHPTDEELVLYYLKRRVSGKSLRFDPIAVVDVYKAEPWDLPGQSKLNTKDLEWYFFSSLETKYGNGWRTNRATQQGYWKTTGKDRTVKHGERVVGMKKTLVFHIGRAPKGERTNWVMHEYRLVEEELEKVGLKQASFVLCRVFEKSGSGPKNGEQYGAPFVEEEWEEDDVLDTGREDSDDLKYLQYHNGEGQDLAAEVTPLNAVLAESSGGDSCNYIQEPLGFEEEDQKNLIGLDKNARMLPGEQELKERFQVAEQYQMPEQFQMDQEPVQNEFFEVEALLGLDESGLTYNDALPPVKTEFENGFSNSVESGTDFDIDDYIKYFDASDLDLTNGVSYDSFGVPVSEGPLLNQPTLDNEVTNCNSQAYMGPAGPSNGYYGEGPSDQKPVIPKVMEDVQCEDWNNSTFTKQISRMLGAIPAPDAFAAESPVKKAALGQNPGAHASSSIHVTAGMIHITGVISGGRNVWSLGKGGDAPVLLSSEITFGDELTISNLINSMVPMRDIMSNKVPSLMMRSGYYFFLFWIMILSVSCRIGSYIYSR